MTEKERQVEDMAKLIGGPDCLERASCYECGAYQRNTCDVYLGALELYNAGYRRQRTEQEDEQ